MHKTPNTAITTLSILFISFILSSLPYKHTNSGNASRGMQFFSINLVPFHKGNGTGGTLGTRWPDNADVFVPSVPLVPLIPRNGTEQGGDSGRYFCSTCSACSAQGVERNKHARSKRSSEGSEGIEGNEGMQVDGDVIPGRCYLDLCRWCPVPPAVLMPRSIWKAVLALLGRTSRPERQPSLPPFAARLCQGKPVTDLRTPSAPLAPAQRDC